MELYAKVLTIAMPIFLLLIIIEKLYGWYKGVNYVPILDSISSISSGITNAVKDVLGISISILSYKWMHDNLALMHQENSILNYFIAFIVIDFYGYWTHRWAHKINIFWNKHAIHHSSEEFNLSCALRQPISNLFNLFTFLLLPAAILGVPTEIISITLPIHLFLQFWYHTRYIGKLGILEKIIVTPSHHRVHHAMNKEYMDKNLGQIFIFWDKLFGTFQEEIDTIQPVYGITRPANTWNPIKINFQHLSLLIHDAIKADKWKDKFLIWFKPTGWRPENFELYYPVEKIEDVNNFKKYNPTQRKSIIWISAIQLLFTLFFVTYLFYNISTIGTPWIFVYGLFIFLTIYSYTELMDESENTMNWEILKFGIGTMVIYFRGDWFEIDQYFEYATIIIIFYLTISLAISFYFSEKIFYEKFLN